MEQRLLTLWKIRLVFTIVLQWLQAFFAQSKHLHNARFARIDELRTLLSLTPPEHSLLLGMGKTGEFIAVSPTKKRKEVGNLLVVAPTRGGKGLLAVSQLLSWKHSVIVNDIKGELFLQTAGYRSTLGNVFVIDPTGVGHRYDPLHNNNTEDALYSSATQLLFHPDEGEGAIFTQRAINMLTQLFLASRMEHMPPFVYVRTLIRLGLENTVARLNSIEPSLATQFLDMAFSQANLTDRFLLSSWGTLTARMRPLLTETVVRSLTHTDVTPGDLLSSDRPITIYLRWKEQDLLALAPLVRLLWGSLIDELITTYDKKQGENCKPVLLLIDEAGRTAIPYLADQATTVVGRGLSLWMAVQSLSQLETVYGRSRATTLRDNMENQLYYRPENQETAEYLERCLGKKSDYAISHHLREGTETSQGKSEQAISLMTAQDIKQLPDEEIIGFHRNFPPLRLFRMDWRNYKLFWQRRKIQPPKLTLLPALTDQDLRTPTTSSPSDLIDPDSITEDRTTDHN